MASVICEKCFSVDRPRKIKRGSWKIEALCWASFPFGIPYIIWRSVTKKLACRQCGHRTVFAKDSPQGKALQAQFDRDIGTAPAAAGPAAPQEKPTPHTPFITAPVPPAPIASPTPSTGYSAARDPNVW